MVGAHLCICGSGYPTTSRCRRNRACALAARHRGGHRGTTTQRGLGAAHRRERLKVLRAAGADDRGIGGRCPRCGLPGYPGNPLTADHRLPRSLGGRTEPSNYVALHLKENVAKGGANRRRR